MLPLIGSYLKFVVLLLFFNFYIGRFYAVLLYFMCKLLNQLFSLFLAPADYTSVGTMLTFNSTVSSLCEDIATSSDNEVSEGSETFTVSLTSSLSPSVLNLQPATATVTIGKSVHATCITGAEGSKGTICPTEITTSDKKKRSSDR